MAEIIFKTEVEDDTSTKETEDQYEQMIEEYVLESTKYNATVAGKNIKVVNATEVFDASKGLGCVDPNSRLNGTICQSEFKNSLYHIVYKLYQIVYKLYVIIKSII